MREYLEELRRAREREQEARRERIEKILFYPVVMLGTMGVMLLMFLVWWYR